MFPLTLEISLLGLFSIGNWSPAVVCPWSNHMSNNSKEGRDTNYGGNNEEAGEGISPDTSHDTTSPFLTKTGKRLVIHHYIHDRYHTKHNSTE